MSRRVLRLLSFLVKEVIDVVRQPRLVVTLIMGPFLILFIFGLGYTGRQRPVDAMVVVPPEAELPEDIRAQAARYADFMPIHAIVDSRHAAMEGLTTGDVDMVVVLPGETYSALLAGKQIVIEILINEYDPVRVQWLHYVSGFMVSDLNQQMLSAIIKQSKEQAAGLQGVTVTLLDRLVEVGEAIQAGDLDLAKERLDDVLALLDRARVDAGLSGLDAAYALSVPVVQQLLDLLVALEELQDELAALRKILDDPAADLEEILDQLKTMRAAIGDIQTLVDALERIPVEVLVSPLKTEVENVSAYKPDFLGFYTPAVLSLLLQHIAVTFGALTMVRERLLGAEEVFRVAPISPWEIITGKYVSYCLLTVLIGLVLSALIVGVLKVPLLSSMLTFILVLVLLTLASLGWGFIISLFSRRESQAVQFSMLILIASVFFGGFFLPLFSLVPSVHFISYALPVTYGTEVLRELVLAGRTPDPAALLPLAGLGLGFYVLCTLIYIWQNKRE